MKDLHDFISQHPNAVITEVDHGQKQILFTENGKEWCWMLFQVDGVEESGCWDITPQDDPGAWDETAQDQQESIGF